MAQTPTIIRDPSDDCTDTVWRSKRVAYGKPATILMPDQSHSIACTVIELSLSGARLSVDRHNRVPSTFALVIDSYRVADCEVVWRRGEDVGVSIRSFRPLVSR